MTTGSNNAEGKSKMIERPSLGSIMMGLVPFLAMCFSVSLWDRIHPMVFGLPFNLFWLILWILLTPLCMWVAYRIHLRQASSRAPGPEDAPR